MQARDAPELQEQEKIADAFADQKALQVLQEAYFAQRNQITANKMRGTVKKILVLALTLPLLGLSCVREGDGDFSQSQLVDKLQAQWQGAQSRVVGFLAEAGANFIENLSAADKKTVEDWLAKNKLNQYGDPKETLYTGGTPLFNEATGETKNRFEYLLEKFPALKEVIKSEISKQVKIEDKK